MDWKGIWESILNFFVSNTWNIILFFSVLFIGLIAIKLIVRILRRIFNHAKVETLAQGFIIGLIKVGLYLVLVLALLKIVGVEITGLMTTLSALVLAIGMALESNIANIANGIVITTMKMFKKGDYISINGVEGSVTGISFLFTTINTVDNKKVIIPNSAIVNNSLTNYGANPIRRVDFTFSVAYESDVELVKSIIKTVIESNGKVILDDTHQAFCRLKVLNSSSLDFFANCWVDGSDYWDVYYYVVENVFNEFKRNKVSVPFTQMEIRERKDVVEMPVVKRALPERVEKERPAPVYKFDLETDSFMDMIKRKNGFAKYKKLLIDQPIDQIKKIIEEQKEKIEEKKEKAEEKKGKNGKKSK